MAALKPEKKKKSFAIFEQYIFYLKKKRVKFLQIGKRKGALHILHYILNKKKKGWGGCKKFVSLKYNFNSKHCQKYLRKIDN